MLLTYCTTCIVHTWRLSEVEFQVYCSSNLRPCRSLGVRVHSTKRDKPGNFGKFEYKRITVYDKENVTMQETPGRFSCNRGTSMN